MSDDKNERVVDLLSATYLRVGDPVNNLTINEVVFFPHLNKLAKFTNISQCINGCIFSKTDWHEWPCEAFSKTSSVVPSCGFEELK